MIVKVRNLGTVERSMPTPANTAVTLAPNEVADFIWPAIDGAFFDNLECSGFDVETVRQLSDIHVRDGSLDLTSLRETALKAEGYIVGTIVCDDDGAHVPNTEKWVSSKDRDEFVRAYEKVLSKVSGASEQEDIDSAVADVESAISTFESARQPGLVPSDPELSIEPVTERLDEADLEMSRTSVSETGEDVQGEGNGWWAKQSDFDTLVEAKRTAVEAASKAEDQGAIDSAAETLKSAVGAFTSSRTAVNLISVSAPEKTAKVGNKTAGELQHVKVTDTAVTGNVHRVQNLQVNGRQLAPGTYLVLDLPEVDKSKVRVSTTVKNSKFTLATIGGLEGKMLLNCLPKMMDGLTLTLKQTNVGTKKAVYEKTLDLSGLELEGSGE